MIDLKNVWKSYLINRTRKQILQDFTFSFPPDRNVAILGPNGAGKSTLLRIVAGAEQPDWGTVTRHGRISWPLGFSGGFNANMSGIENVRFVARVYGADVQEVTDYVEDFTELGRSLKLPIKTYSSGMKARLAFGMSMAIDFDCYLIDETTAVGDETFKKKSREVFRNKLKHSRIIMVSHSMSEIREICDAAIYISKKKQFYFDNIEDAIVYYKAHS